MPVESFGGYRRNDDYLRDVARGGVVGAEPFNSFGRRAATGAVTTQVLWSNGAYAVPPSAGVQMSVVSTSASDTSNGTGIRSVIVSYLDVNLNPYTEIVVLNGLTPVNMVAAKVRFVQGLYGYTFGSGLAAAGDISVSASSIVYSQIPTGDVRCACSARMVPKGKHLIIASMYASSVSTAVALTSVMLSSSKFQGIDYLSNGVFIPLVQAGFQDGGMSIPLNPPLSFDEGDCVLMQYNQSGTATVTGGWSGWLENVS